MAKFRITWSSGVVEEVEQGDVSTIEGYINCRFGKNHPSDILPEVEMIQLLEPSEPVLEVVKPAKKSKK